MLVLVAGCSQQIPLPTHVDGGGGIGFGGKLGGDPPCLWLEYDTGQRTIVIWPAGFTARQDPVRVVAPDGRVIATVGDLIEGGGDPGRGGPDLGIGPSLGDQLGERTARQVPDTAAPAIDPPAALRAALTFLSYATHGSMRLHFRLVGGPFHAFHSRKRLLRGLAGAISAYSGPVRSPKATQGSV